MTHADGLDWQPDTELSGFEVTPLPARYADRTFTAQLVRADSQRAGTDRAVLYVHGLTDYFFQTHLAQAYLEAGYAFYALDLHGYGRALEDIPRPNYCQKLEEYFPEISAAIDAIKSTGADKLVVNGHSTGGLITALYAAEGERRDQIDALFLNSPFLDFPVNGLERIALKAVAWLGRWFTDFSFKSGMPSLYARTISDEFEGEWDYNMALKPASGFPLYAAWARAVLMGQKRAQAGLDIACPVLVMHSDRSGRAIKWSDDLFHRDVVLDVDDMRRYGPGLGRDVTLKAIDGGMHDLVLSLPPAREQLFAELFPWLEGKLSSDAGRQTSEA